MKNTLYYIELKCTEDAAKEYAAACRRLHADVKRIDIITYCINSFPDVKAADALRIANDIVMK